MPPLREHSDDMPLLIEQIIEEEDGNKTAAARRLAVARETLWKKLND